MAVLPHQERDLTRCDSERDSLTQAFKLFV